LCSCCIPFHSNPINQGWKRRERKEVEEEMERTSEVRKEGNKKTSWK